MTSGKCERCPEGLGIDPENQTCVQCDTDSYYGIDLMTGYCTFCKGDKFIDPVTKKCRCENKKGYWDEIDQCINCSNRFYPFGCIDPETLLCRHPYQSSHEGIDRETYFCRICEDDEGINPYNGYCEKCPENAKVNSDYRCECEYGLGLDKNNKCIVCEGINGIHDETRHCERCSEYQGINNNTRYCEECNPDNNRCIDNITGICIELTDGMMANDQYYCRCQNNFGFDQTTGNCIDCRAHNMAVDFFTGFCIECPSDLIIDEETNMCVCPFKKGFASDNKHCSRCGSGVDKKTRRCSTSWLSSECIDRKTGFWVKTLENQKRNKDNFCTCIENYGFNYTLNLCERCGEGQILDAITNECTDCTGPEMGTFDGECIKCEILGASVDQNTHKCKCGEKEGFDEDDDNRCSDVSSRRFSCIDLET